MASPQAKKPPTEIPVEALTAAITRAPVALVCVARAPVALQAAAVADFLFLFFWFFKGT